MLTGDATTCAEAKSFLGDTLEVVAVKEASGRNSALCRPPAATAIEITAAAKRALGALGSVKPFVLEGPAVIEVDFLTMVQCNRAARTANIEQIGPMTVSVHGASLWDQYQYLWAALRAALNEPASFLA